MYTTGPPLTLPDALPFWSRCLWHAKSTDPPQAITPRHLSPHPGHPLPQPCSHSDPKNAELKGLRPERPKNRMLRPYPFNAPPASCRQRRGDPRTISADHPQMLRSALETDADRYYVGAWHGRITNRRPVQKRLVVPVIFVGKIIHPELALTFIV